MATIIVFDSIKGGVGKSTLAVQFAVLLSKKYRVSIMDGDAQQSLNVWLFRRKQASKAYNDIGLVTNVEGLKSDKYDYIIADSAGVDSQIGRYLLGVADIIISPLKPSQVDLDTISKHDSVLREAAKLNKKLKAFYILNMCATHIWDKKRGETLDYLNNLREKNKIFASVVQCPIYKRELLSTAFGDGESCFDKKYNKSQGEIECAMNEILGE